MGEEVNIMKPKSQLEPTVFVIFGGAGDLTWRKLVPALYDLSQDRSMPADFSVIVVDRIALSDERAAKASPVRRQEVLAPGSSENRRRERMYQAYQLPAGRF